MSRLFEQTSIHVPNTRPMPAYKITCCKCGASEKVSVATRGGVMAPEGIANKFRGKGWAIGTRAGADLCPACQVRQKKEKAVMSEKQADNILEFSSAIRAEPPREMSKEDRRVIFAKLNDVYIDESKGYGKEWSDGKVAEDLGVPRAWVVSIREENFGGNGGNVELWDMIASARTVIGALRERETQIDLRMKTHFKDIEEFANSLKKEVKLKIDEIEKEINKVMKNAQVR